MAFFLGLGLGMVALLGSEVEIGEEPFVALRLLVKYLNMAACPRIIDG